MTKDEQRAYNAAYYQKNKARLLIAFKDWKEQNREAHRAGSAKWQSDNKTRSHEMKMAYKARHPDRVTLANKRTTLAALASHAARQRVRNKTASRPDVQVMAVYVLAASDTPIKCHWCAAETEKKLRHVDHVIPLCEGGEHKAWNLVIACIPCNLKKGRLLPEIFRQGEHHRR
jgi:5-methylcytosine-specific restriction endonuclease McrA